MKLADLRVVRADIPVQRPHKMSFTTLETVNFVFVRLETSDGHVGWGEAACLGGPTWSEESAESVAATIERYMKAYRETLDWMYSDPASLKLYAEFVGIPEARAQRTRDPLHQSSALGQSHHAQPQRHDPDQRECNGDRRLGAVERTRRYIFQPIIPAAYRHRQQDQCEPDVVEHALRCTRAH